MCGMEKPSFRIAIALVCRDGRWLTARRPMAVHLGGLWEFPGGKIDTVETPTQAALRELWEECGVVARPVDELTPRTHEYDDRVVTIHPVCCRWQSGEAQQLNNQECRWVTLGELEGLPMPAANAAILAEMKRLFSRL